MPRFNRAATERLASALSLMAPDFEFAVLDALEKRADPNVMVQYSMSGGKTPVSLSPLAVAALVDNPMLARGLLQAGAAPAQAQTDLIDLVASSGRRQHVRRHAIDGLRHLARILDHRISDLQTLGRSVGPFAEPFRPSRDSLSKIARKGLAPQL